MGFEIGRVVTLIRGSHKIFDLNLVANNSKIGTFVAF